MDVFFEIHKDNPREGPGDFESTQKAFLFLKGLPLNPYILDIGCGPGKQSFDLLKLTKCNITAVDNHQPFIDKLSQKVKSLNLEDRITVLNKDMFNFDFEPESFDILWSEGAIYQIGFEKGLTLWKTLLKRNGYIAVTEISWIKENPPFEIYSHWTKEYPDMKDVKTNIEIIRASGYQLIDHFTLPESAWWDNYYYSIKEKLASLEEKYADNEEALKVIEMEKIEMDLYERYSDYYGYEFYIMQKI